MGTYTAWITQECRVIEKQEGLTRDKAHGLHEEYCARLESEGWRRSNRSIVDIQPYLGREGQETCYLKGRNSRLVRWEAMGVGIGLR